MRILANENFPREAVEALRARGHDVFWARTDSPGSPDSQVVDCAASQRRILVTFDKDFGELAFRRGLSSPAGIVLFRIKAPHLRTWLKWWLLSSRAAPIGLATSRSLKKDESG